MKKPLSWDLVYTMVGSMFSDDHGGIDHLRSRVEFYGNEGVCLFKFFVTSDDPQVEQFLFLLYYIAAYLHGLVYWCKVYWPICQA